MVALLTGLKLRLLRNRLRAEPWVLVGLAIAVVMGLTATGLAVVGAVTLAALAAADAATVVVIAGSALVAGWALVPLLAFGVDETLEPSRFVTLPVRARDLVPGLTVAAVVGVPGISTALVCLSLVGTWSGAPVAAVAAVACAPVAVATCVLSSRTITALVARSFTRRGRELGAVFGVILFIGLTMVPGILAGSGFGRGLSADSFRSTAHVLGWTPLGLAFAVPGDLATGQGARAVARFALALLVVLLLGLGWSRLLAAQLEQPVSPSGGRRSVRSGARLGRPLLDRLPDGATWAVASRSLRYWRRDPRYVVIVATSVLAALVPLVAIAAGGTRAPLLAAGPYSAFLLALSTSNGAGYDGSAFAAHLAAGVTGRDDRAGRAAGLLLWGLPLVVAMAVGGALLARRPDLVPACIGAAVGMLLGGTGSSAVTGAALPYPVVEPGGNPFQTNAGGGVQALLGQFATTLAATTVSLPGLAGLLASATIWPWLTWPTLVVGTATGAAGLVAGVVAGGRIVDARGPEILAAVRRST